MQKHIHKLTLLFLTLCLVIAGAISSPSRASAAKIKLSKKSVTITKGKSVTLKLKGTKKKPKWSTSNKKIATVSKKGKVVGKKAGNAKITAKIGKKKYVCKVKVTKPKPVPRPVPEPTPQPTPIPTPEPTSTPEPTPIPEPEKPAEAEPTKAPVSEPASYTVQKGDTLIGICIKTYGSDARVAEICSLNNISNPDDIKEGARILLP